MVNTNWCRTGKSFTAEVKIKIVVGFGGGQVQRLNADSFGQIGTIRFFQKVRNLIVILFKIESEMQPLGGTYRHIIIRLCSPVPVSHLVNLTNQYYFPVLNFIQSQWFYPYFSISFDLNNTKSPVQTRLLHKKFSCKFGSHPKNTKIFDVLFTETSPKDVRKMSFYGRMIG